MSLISLRSVCLEYPASPCPFIRVFKNQIIQFRGIPTRSSTRTVKIFFPSKFLWSPKPVNMAAAQEPNAEELAALQDQHAPVIGAEPAVVAAEPAGVAAEPAVNNRNEVLMLV